MTRVIIIVCDLGDKPSGFNRSIECDIRQFTPLMVLDKLTSTVRELGADTVTERDRTEGVERME